MPSADGVESVDLTTISDELATAIGRLLYRVWPKPDKDAAYRAAQIKALGAEHAPSLPVAQLPVAPHAFYIPDGDAVIAVAVMRPRVIAFQEPSGSDPIREVEQLVLGLSHVGSDPDRRGEGLGARVVKAAFGMIDEGAAPVCLFQTSHPVRPFYERLGSRLVANRVFSSTADDPTANPFWDDVVMRYPASAAWRDGDIDLRGPGY